MNNISAPSFIYWAIQITIWIFCFTYIITFNNKKETRSGKTSLPLKLFLIILAPFWSYFMLLYAAGIMDHHFKIKWVSFYNYKYEYVIGVSIIYYIFMFIKLRKERD